MQGNLWNLFDLLHAIKTQQDPTAYGGGTSQQLQSLLHSDSLYTDGKPRRTRSVYTKEPSYAWSFGNMCGQHPLAQHRCKPTSLCSFKQPLCSVATTYEHALHAKTWHYASQPCFFHMAECDNPWVLLHTLFNPQPTTLRISKWTCVVICTVQQPEAYGRKAGRRGDFEVLFGSLTGSTAFGNGMVNRSSLSPKDVLLGPPPADTCTSCMSAAAAAAAPSAAVATGAAWLLVATGGAGDPPPERLP